MARETNLYHNLVTNEDKLTELLANLLQFPAVKQTFTELLVKKLNWPGLSFQHRNVNTQKNLAGLGRPDLVIESDSTCIFIECKINDYRPLTPNQPVGYLQYLDTQADKQCALIFLVPFYYEHEALIRTRAAANSKTQLEIIYWNELQEHLERSELAGQNVAVEHFVALLQAWFEIKPIRFSEEEMELLQNKAYPAQLLKLFELITEVSGKLPKSFDTEHYSDQYSFGYYVTDQKNEYVLWFGCDFKYWAECGTFFLVGVGDDEDEDFSQVVINRFKGKFGQNSWYEPWSWYLSSIPLALIEDPQNVKQLIHFIAKTAEHCSDSHG
ncbi:MAG TPA: hypothetical protein PKE64_31435 [Anaerolineae bacterium]|nr:hypothetical protein [Anaerolineae bacterium]